MASYTWGFVEGLKSIAFHLFLNSKHSKKITNLMS